MSFKFLLLGVLIPLFVLPTNYAQRSNSEVIDTDAKIKKLSQDRNALLEQLKTYGIQRRRLSEEIAEIRNKERNLRREEETIRKKISALRKGEEIELKLRKYGANEPDSAPLVAGPMKKGEQHKGNLLSLNTDAKVVTITTLIPDSGYSTNIYVIGEGAVILLNATPVTMEDLPLQTRVSYWVHPQDASTITWMEVYTK